MVKTFSFPSVYESTIREYYTSNDPILGFSKIKVDDSDYLVGLQALNEGVSPHKSLNASPSDREYKLIAHSALFFWLTTLSQTELKTATLLSIR